MNLSNVSEVTREGVNKFNGKLELSKGVTLPISFTRVSSGWYVNLVVAVDGRPWHEFGGDDAGELKQAKQVWAELDVLATNHDNDREASRAAYRASVNATLAI